MTSHPNHDGAREEAVQGRGLAVPKKVKIIYGKIPPVRQITKGVHTDITGLIGGQIKTEAKMRPKVDLLHEINVTAEEAFEPGARVLAKKYQEQKLTIPKTLTISSGEIHPVELKTTFRDQPVNVISLSGMEKGSGQYPENVDGVVINDSNEEYLDVAMICGGAEGPENSAMTNAATVYAADYLNYNFDHRFPINLERLDHKLSPIKEDLGLAEKKLEGMVARLNMKNYALEVSSNSENIHCLVIDPSSGKMESFRDRKNIELMEKNQQEMEDIDWEKIRGMAAKEYQGSKGKNMMKLISAIEEKGLNDEEKAKLMARIPRPRTFTTAMPVSQGDVVVLVSDKLVNALGKGEAGIVQMITEGINAGKQIPEITGEILAVIKKKQDNYDIEENTRTLVAFRVP